MKINDYPVTSQSLGAHYHKTHTVFKVWAPTQTQIALALYEHPRAPHRTLHPMEKDKEGVFSVRIEGDLHGHFYTFIVDAQYEVTDPYGLSACANGVRTAVVDLEKTHPPGWLDHERPKGHHGCDKVLYELHIKDFTGHASSGATHKGKFLGLSENGTSFEGVPTGLDHLVDLGVTHVHLMPLYDYLTVDETLDSDSNYNWGYDPEHYNMPEGSYATDANDPVSRIYELKQAILSLHERGIKVILDVVYNHTYRTTDSNFNVLVPKYYHRTTEDGIFSNGSGCGNEFASDHPMARRFLIHSLVYWTKEFQVDGFRFDLMALTDQVTVDLFMKELRKIDPHIFVYGEPWMGGLSTLPENQRVYKGAQCGKGYALFNDDFRDAIKGDNDGTGKGFIHANRDAKHALKVGIAGSIPFDASHIGFATEPSETINYFNSHDNLILADKIRKASPEADWYTQLRLNKLAFSVLFTSQGIPFFHAGNEFLRDKQGHHNTYNAPLSINAIQWQLKKEHLAFYHYVKDLIALRRDFPCLRLESAASIKKQLHFVGDDILHVSESDAVMYTISQHEDPSFNCLLVIHNPSHEALFVEVEELMKHMCTHEKTKKKHHGATIAQIFDERGRLETPEIIDSKTHHILKVHGISTAIYTFKAHP